MTSQRVVFYLPEEKYYVLWQMAMKEQKNVVEYLKDMVDGIIGNNDADMVEAIIKKYSPFLKKEGDTIYLVEDFKNGKFMSNKQSNTLLPDMRNIGYVYKKIDNKTAFVPSS